MCACDHADTLAARQRARPAHLRRLRELLDEGRLLVAGPHPRIDGEAPGQAGFSGSLIIAEFDSLEAARACADVDPYCAADVYAEVDVKPFVNALP
ncbi:MAG: YciI family protein [bacterium]